MQHGSPDALLPQLIVYYNDHHVKVQAPRTTTKSADH